MGIIMYSTELVNSVVCDEQVWPSGKAGKQLGICIALSG